MKFVPISSAKGLKPNEVFYTLNEAGEYGTAKLLSKIETAQGTSFVFEVPQYFDEDRPMVKPIHVNNITHVCKMKSRALVEGAVNAN